jgi:hypothetical protein
MSRFGSTATFYYASGDVLSSGTYLYLTPANMPNYPFESFEDSDRQIHKTKTGRKYIYQNYSLQGYKFNFSNLNELTRGSLKRMYDARPIFNFTTNGSTWGTFRFAEESWQDSESAFELYDLNFGIEEDA